MHTPCLCTLHRSWRTKQSQPQPLPLTDCALREPMGKEVRFLSRIASRRIKHHSQLIEDAPAVICLVLKNSLVDTALNVLHFLLLFASLTFLRRVFLLFFFPQYLLREQPGTESPLVGIYCLLFCLCCFSLLLNSTTSVTVTPPFFHKEKTWKARS